MASYHVAAPHSPSIEMSNVNEYPFHHRPQHQQYPDDRYGSLQSTINNNTYAVGSGSDTAYRPPVKTVEEARVLARTPSPTPSEQHALRTGVLDWKTLSSWRFWIRREWLWYYVAGAIILTITILITVFHKQIVGWLTPATQWLHDLKLGWLVPIGVLFVISFPPLFGHEIVAILCGLVWGLWIGFAIVSAGTFLGEVGNFYAFKYCCRSRGEKLERTNITYACLAKVVRDGGFKIALIARLSAIPGHFTTAVFSTCGMGIIVFSIAAILSMPKQFITVYLGVILEQSSTGEQDTKSRIISDVVLGITILITILAMWYIFRQMNKAKPEVIYQRRKARQHKLARAAFNSASHSSFDSDDDGIPLTLKVQAPSVKDNRSSIGSSSHGHDDGQHLYAPRPRKSPNKLHKLPKPNPVAGVEYGYGGGYGYPGAGNGQGHMHGRASTDEVGWDMGAPPMQHARPEDVGLRMYQPGGQSSASSSRDTLVPSQAQRDMEAAPSLPLSGHQPGGTQREWSEDSSYLYGYGHGAEPTDASYRTAREPSADEFVGGAAPARTGGGGGATSPPPPSYRTNAAGW